MEKFQIGDWVYYDGNEISWLYGAVGFVTIAGEVKCAVEFVKDNQGNRIRTEKFIPVKDLIKSKTTSPLSEEEIKALIDIALDTRDFEWAKQLMEQFEGRKNEKVGGGV
jgi:hypothetical protein